MSTSKVRSLVDTASKNLITQLLKSFLIEIKTCDFIKFYCQIIIIYYPGFSIIQFSYKEQNYPSLLKRKKYQ